MLRVGIRGAGLAGMSLALELLRSGTHVAVTLFDTRPRLPHPARTFCFFATPEARIPVPPYKQWRSVRFAGAEFSREIACNDTPYTMIRGEDFFSHALAMLEQGGVQFVWSAVQVEVVRGAIIADGRSFGFDLVIDAAHQNELTDPLLWQSFAGLHVEAGTDVFNPNEALLMEMLPSQESSAVAFIYLLPFSSTSALVEHTTFSISPLDCEEHLTGCVRWLAQRGIGEYKILARERGVIPMGVTTARRARGIIRVGTQSGAVRAATGYGFQRVLAQTEQLVAATNPINGIVGSHWQVTAPLWQRVGDRVLLRALRNNPLRGGKLLESFLKDSPEADLIPFLADTASLTAGVRVMRTVPKLSMMRALFGC